MPARPSRAPPAWCWPGKEPAKRYILGVDMQISVDIGTLIERSPEIRKGRTCIAGTGVTVRRIAGWHNMGLAPEEIAAKMEHLTLAQIHAALAYYYANCDEIDSDIAAEDAAVEEIFQARA